MRTRGLVAVLVCVAAATGCARGEGEGPPVRFTVPEGSGLSAVTDTLAARGLVGSPPVFKVYARVRGDDRALKPGVYEVPEGTGWGAILDKLVAGDVIRMRITVPEGWDLRQIAPRIAEATGADPDSVHAFLMDPATAERFEVPGPTMEGYLYPATYQLPAGAPVERVVRVMVDQYRALWTEGRRTLADSLGMTEREVVTLASIVEKEARVWPERPRIASVYHNRLRRGMRLEADPTVQYAVGEHQRRLLFRHIDETADNPYNTYRNAGLPPGPIASPSRGAIDATLSPADEPYLFMVARPDGTHHFTRTFQEHRRAVAAARAAARASADTPGRAGERR
jgi:UPF0755 protein